MKLQYLIYALLLISISNSVDAQSSDSVCTEDCVENDLSPSGIMLAHEHSKGMWKFSYRYMNMIMENNLSGIQRVDDNFIFNNYIMSPQHMRMDMHMLMGMYGFTNKFSVMAMLNYNVYSMQMNSLGSMNMMNGMMSMNNSTAMNNHSGGIGDIKAYAVYKLLKHNAHILFVNVGVNIPVGSIYITGKSSDVMYSDKRLPYAMQLGSGTFDFMPGFTYLMKQNKFSASVQVTSVVRPFNNSLNYCLGNELNLNGWIAYKWLNWVSSSVRVDDNYTSMIVGSDAGLTQMTEPSAAPFNYGRQTISVYGGLNFYINKTFLKNSKLTVEYGVPAYQFVNGVQMALKATCYLGWMVSF